MLHYLTIVVIFFLCLIDDGDGVSTANEKGPFLFISIFSTYSNRPRRDALRQTWLTLVPKLSTPKQQIKYVFILSKVEPLSKGEENKEMLEEIKQHRDIFILNGQAEHYLNLMPKLVTSLQIAFGSSHYLLKTDDDSLVDLQRILALLQARQNGKIPTGQDPLYYGKIDEESKLVLRGDRDYDALYGPTFNPCVTAHLKKFIDKGDPTARCPFVDEILGKSLGSISISRYAHGAGYILGGGLGVRLAKRPLPMVDTPHEDHSLGQWVKHLDRNVGVSVDYVNDDGIADWVECAEYMNQTIIHRLKPERLFCIWNAMNDPMKPTFGQNKTCCK